MVENMRFTRARFKLYLSWYNAHEETLSAQALAAHLGGGNTAGFGRSLSAVTPNSHSLPVRVD